MPAYISDNEGLGQYVLICLLEAFITYSHGEKKAFYSLKSWLESLENTLLYYNFGSDVHLGLFYNAYLHTALRSGDSVCRT